MGKLLDLLFGFVAYLCVGTVISLALIVAYFWQTDRLTNEKMFRVIAVLQDVDLEKLTDEPSKSPEDVPSEEPSIDEVTHFQQVLDRNFEIQKLALQRGKQLYDSSLRQLIEQSDRYDRLVQDLQGRLSKEQELTTKENVSKVVSQLEQVTPEVGKNQLMMWIQEKRMDDAILLMSKMNEKKLSKILNAFETTEDEQAVLHSIHLRIMESGGQGGKLEKALKELEAAKGA
ncbi:MAG: hypothetical protein IT425_04660 [Pirellulales bacterium]|nr:hypothetical protein [Pirellulales bacterium]